MDADAVLLGVATGGLGSLATALVLTALRGEIANVNVALVLVLCVFAGAVVGGRTAGAWSALVAAMSFDFFHTRPYNSLKIADLNDVVTAVLLLGCGLAVGELAVRWRRAGRLVEDDRRQVRRLHRVSELAARGEDVDDLVLAVTAELIATLQLAGCAFEPPPFTTRMPRMERDGSIAPGRRSPVWFELPTGGIELPVVAGGETLGRFVLTAFPGTTVSTQRRLVAVSLADQVGIALYHAASA